jgi:hypothetical protein
MPFTQLSEEHVLSFLFGSTTFVVPNTYYLALFAATSWAPFPNTWTANEFVIGSKFTTTNPHIYQVTSGGTNYTGHTEPVWHEGAGATTNETSPGTASYVECYNLLQAQTFTSNLEVSAAGYARTPVTNNTTNFPAASGPSPSFSQLATTIAFPTATGAWGQAVGVGFYDALTGGNLWAWGLLSTPTTISIGATPTFAPSSGELTITLA